MTQEILQRVYFNNTVLEYCIAVGVIVSGLLVIYIINKILIHRMKAWAEKTRTSVDDLLITSLERRLLPNLYYFAIYFGLKYINIHPKIDRVINFLAIALFVLIGIRLSTALVQFAIESYSSKKEGSQRRKMLVKGMLPAVRVTLWIIGIIILLDNMGVKISALVAGLGIGGIAVAFAAQTVLGDVFSYFTIFIDRPFEEGDFLIVGDYLGTVEQIGIKSTRLRSLGGEQLIFSNTDLTNSRIRNYKRMVNRRVVFKLGVIYQTTLEQLKEIPEIIKKVIHSTEGTQFDRAHFSSYGDFSQDFEVVYHVIGGDYTKHMDLQQQIFFKIREEFDKKKIEFAYPTQTLFVNKD